MTSNHVEAAAEVVLQNEPPGAPFVASPHWGESLVQLAGFLSNANPDRLAAYTTFMMDSFDHLIFFLPKMLGIAKCHAMVENTLHRHILLRNLLGSQSLKMKFHRLLHGLRNVQCQLPKLLMPPCPPVLQP